MFDDEHIVTERLDEVVGLEFYVFEIRETAEMQRQKDRGRAVENLAYLGDSRAEIAIIVRQRIRVDRVGEDLVAVHYFCPDFHIDIVLKHGCFVNKIGGANIGESIDKTLIIL